MLKKLLMTSKFKTKNILSNPITNSQNSIGSQKKRVKSWKKCFTDMKNMRTISKKKQKSEMTLNQLSMLSRMTFKIQVSKLSALKNRSINSKNQLLKKSAGSMKMLGLLENQILKNTLKLSKIFTLLLSTDQININTEKAPTIKHFRFFLLFTKKLLNWMNLNLGFRKKQRLISKK